MNDRLLDSLTDKDGIQFWKTWNSINKVGNLISSRINGETNDERIANEFATYFESVYSGSDSPVHTAMKVEFENAYTKYYSDHVMDNISPFCCRRNKFRRRL